MISLFRMDSVLGRSTGFAAWMDSAMERLPASSCKGGTLELTLGLSLPFFSGRASRTKGFLRRPKLLLLQPFQSILEISFGSKASTHIRLQAAIWIRTAVQVTPKFLKQLLSRGSHESSQAPHRELGVLGTFQRHGI